MHRPFHSCLHFSLQDADIFIIIASLYIAPDSLTNSVFLFAHKDHLEMVDCCLYPIVMTAAMEL